jgi:hypothetical protein
MPNPTKANPKPGEPRYVSWRGELIAELALTRAGLTVQDAPPRPFDFLVSTPDGFYFLVDVKAYSSMHGRNPPAFDKALGRHRWPVEASLLRAVGEVNLPAVLLVVDADREVGHYARLDRVPGGDADERAAFVWLVKDRDLSPESLAGMVAELRHDWAATRRPA